MKFTSTQAKLIQYDNEFEVSFKKVNSKVDISEIKQITAHGKSLSVEVKEYRNKRSLDANSYCWILCQKIAEAIRNTKEFVYQRAIKQVGQFQILPIKNDAIERWFEVWSSKGLGWFSEVLDDSKLEGYKKVIPYFGSSVYDSKEMAVLIDELVCQCQELGIETMSKNEINSLIENWEAKT